MALRSLYEVAAPAKLNLFLHIVGRRADGYHLLQSLFVLIDWCDTLHFELRGDGRLARHDLNTALPDDDLCLRAARALQTASATALGADIHIEKQVPSGAGMGGGSSDAASTLLALNRLWGLHWPRQRLMALGLTLGADVPFFIGGRNALVEGVGERLTPATLPRQTLAVVKPAAGAETRAVFASPLLVRDSEAAILEGFRADAFGGVALHFPEGFVQTHGRNDMQLAAQALCPEIGQAAQWLQRHFGNSRMTGSGSAVFARLAEKLTEKNGAVGLPEATMPADLPPEWAGRLCRSLELHPLAGWAEDGSEV